MKGTGIVRRIDELGRVVIPAELRRVLEISDKDELEIFVDQDQIILQKFEPKCIFCGLSEELVTYKGKNVCQKCISNMCRSLRASV